MRAPVHIPQCKPHSGHHSLPDPRLVVSAGCWEESSQVNIMPMVMVSPRVFLIPKAAALHLPARPSSAGGDHQQHQHQQMVISRDGAWQGPHFNSSQDLGILTARSGRTALRRPTGSSLAVASFLVSRPPMPSPSPPPSHPSRPSWTPKAISARWLRSVSELFADPGCKVVSWRNEGAIRQNWVNFSTPGAPPLSYVST